MLKGYEDKKDEIARMVREIDVLCEDVVKLEQLLGSKNMAIWNY